MLKQNNWVRLKNPIPPYTHGKVISANEEKVYVKLSILTRTWRGMEADISKETKLLFTNDVKQICKPILVDGEYTVEREDYTTCPVCGTVKNKLGTCRICGE